MTCQVIQKNGKRCRRTAQYSVLAVTLDGDKQVALCTRHTDEACSRVEGPFPLAIDDDAYGLNMVEEDEDESHGKPDR
jgi:hypothetical protein